MQGEDDRRAGGGASDKRGGFRREQDREMHAAALRALETSIKAQASIEKHEAVCAERFRGILETMGTVKFVLFWAGGALVGGMGAVIYALFFRH